MTPTVGNFRMASDLNGISSIQQNQYLINKNMTPTPEEAKTPFELFKDKIDRHNSQFAHRFPSQCAECSLDRLSIQIFNEAMRDYASACAKAAADEAETLYTERIEKAGSELPNPMTEFPLDGVSRTYLAKQTNRVFGAEWMKQAASVVIATEREKYKQKIKDIKAAHEIVDKINKGMIAAKNEEIIELKEALQQSHFKSI